MKIYFDVLYGDLNMDMVPNMDHGHFYMVDVGTGVPDCIPCTQRRKCTAWIKQITILNIVNIGIPLAWSLHGVHPTWSDVT